MAVETALLVASASLSVASAALARKRAENQIPSDYPQSFAERGSLAPLLIGRDVVGPSVCWIGKRNTEKEGSDIKGIVGSIVGQDVKMKIFYQPAFHVLAIGPGAKLHSIKEAGEVIWRGPITPTTHPSGTDVNLGKKGVFTVYWGESDQPLNADLAAELEHDSVHPFIFYVHWKPKRLGQTPQWQELIYDIEVDPFQSALALTDSRIPEKRVLSGQSFAIVRTNVEGRFRIMISGNHVDRFRAGTVFKLTGNAVADGDYTVDTVKYLPQGDLTRIYVDTQPLVIDNNGTVEPYDLVNYDGINPAHIIYQLLFSPWPHGRGFPTSLVDLDSLEELGLLLEQERLPMKVIANRGEKIEALLEMILQDAGVGVPMHRGKMRFIAIREPSGSVPSLPDDLILPPLPEIRNPMVGIEPRSTNRVIYKFRDRNRNFKPNPLPIDEDGSAERAMHRQMRQVTLHTVTSFPDAVKVAERRSQEDLGGGVANKIHANREARHLVPGQPLTVNGFPDTLRISSIEYPDTLSGKVVIHAPTDRYGVPAASFKNEDGGAFPQPAPEPDADLASAVIEVPGYDRPGTIQVMAPRIRGNDDISAAEIWLSSDGTTYTSIGGTADIQAGGLLDANFPATGWFLDQGPTFEAANDDVLDLPDYTGDDASWFAGRIVVIMGQEICYAKKVTALGGNQYRVDGLIRARFDTQRAVHSTNDPIFIFKRTDIGRYTDLIFAPGAHVYFKLQPISDSGTSVPLSQIAAIELNPMLGKGVIPVTPSALVTQNIAGRRNVFDRGTDVELSWAWRDQEDKTAGAGLQPAGQPTVFPELRGSFTLEFWATSGGPSSPERTVTGITARGPDGDIVYTYTDANRDTDFGSDTEFEVRLKHVIGGFESQELTILVAELL